MLRDWHTFPEIGEAGAEHLFSPRRKPAPRILGGLSPEVLVKTVRGEVMLCDLVPGDRVLTRDNGYQPVRWVGPCHEASAEPAALLCIPAGALAPGLPVRDLHLSAHQRVLVGAGALAFLGSDVETLSRAHDLCRALGMGHAVARGTGACWHILMERHELILADDVWTETFQPERWFFAAAEPELQHSLQEICPELARQDCHRAFPAARSQTRLSAA